MCITFNCRFQKDSRPHKNIEGGATRVGGLGSTNYFGESLGEAEQNTKHELLLRKPVHPFNFP